MCMRCLLTTTIFKWPGEHIYIGHTLELAVWSRWAHFCVGIGTSGAGRRIFRSLTATEVAVGFSDTVAASPGTIC